MRQSGKIKKARMAVERAKRAKSKQPRFESTEEMYSGFLSFIGRAGSFDWADRPEYGPESAKYDDWLQDAWRQEPLWAGVVNQATLVDSSRGWTLRGGRNQVRKFTAMLHRADDEKGWRNYFRKQALAYRTTNFGATTELGRDHPGALWRGDRWVKLGLQEIWHVDSSRCNWTGNPELPLQYSPVNGDTQFWLPYEFFNVCSMPSQEEEFHGLGYCATARAINIMMLLYFVFAHDTELLDSRIPDGLLLLNGITRGQWQKAMARRNADLDEMERNYFGGVAILAGAVGADATLIALSQLPQRFDREVFVNQAMYAYSLIAGFDTREFWPASSGTLGTGTETQEQHRKALTKGALELPHAWQERFQMELSPTLQFNFTDRDPRAAQDNAEMFSTIALALNRIRGDQHNPATLSNEEERKVLADYGIIPKEWVEAVGESEATDIETVRSICRSIPEVRLACERFPKEPIVQYEWPQRRMITIWDAGEDALIQRVWGLAKKVVRQDDGEVLYEDGDTIITEGDVKKAIKSVATISGDWLAKYLEDGLSEPLPIDDALEAADEIAKIFSAQALAAVNTIPDKKIKQRIMSPWEIAMRIAVKESFIAQFILGRGGRGKMTQSDWGKCGSQIKFQYGKLSGFAKEIEAGELSRAQIEARSQMYIAASRQAYEEGRRRLISETIEIAEVRWVLDVAEHCQDCLGLAANDWVPYDDGKAFDGCIPCGGCTECLTNCKCHLEYKTKDGRIL